jgi:glycosyltransferase involved in cell wall biosynthesis
MRGGEKVLEAIAELFPGADVFTLVYDPERISPGIRRHRITASWLNRIPAAPRIYPHLLPLHPRAFRSLDVRDYDLVVSSDSSLAKGIRTSPETLHICYCHSPPRYLWDMCEEYLRDEGALKRLVAGLAFPRLREFDRCAAQRVTHFVANSRNVQDRIRRHYGRESTVIYPPVEVFDGPRSAGPFEQYLVLGQLVSYKRVDLAVRSFTQLGRPLVVIGEGPEKDALRKMAGPSVRFLGWQPDEVVREHLASCRALVFPGEEDFGIVPVEAQMAGRPVIAYGRGGARETVEPGVSGIFFERQEPDCLAAAVEQLDPIEPTFSVQSIRKNALRFERSVFDREFAAFVEDRIRERGL